MKNKKSVEVQMQEANPEFVTEVAGLSVEQLDSRLAETTKATEAVQDAKDADEELEQVSTHKSELEAPYRDAKKALRLKSRYLIALIKEKGGK